ncbi:MAG: hypothetical protein R2750_14675 [Bacteroidales bacterium]
MKSSVIIKTVLCSLFLFSAASIYSQSCTQCDNTGDPPGTHASEIGENTTASGTCSFAGGVGSDAEGGYSFAFGNTAKALGHHCVAIGGITTADGSSSFALGKYCKANGSSTFTLGAGVNSSYLLDNTISNSLVIGFGSDRPTFFIGGSSGVGLTGKVGIGDVTDPQAKLHIKADQNEPATVFIEPYGFTAGESAKLRLGTMDYGISSGYGKLYFITGGNYIFNSANANVGIGVLTPHEKLEVNGNIKQYPGYSIETDKILASGENGLKLYNNLEQGIFVNNAGNVGIGTTSPGSNLDVSGTLKATYFEGDGSLLTNVNDGDWMVNGNNIYRQNGLVGIGPNTVPECRLHISDNLANADGEFFKVTNDGFLAGGSTIIGKEANNGPVLYQQAGNVNFGDSGPHMAIRQKANNGDVGMDISTFTDLNGDIVWADIEAPNSSFYLIAKNDIIFRTGISKFEQMYIKANGDVGIGVSEPSAKLDVNGKILCGELEIINLTEWKDCVFEKEYILRPLHEIEHFIKTNGHLPEIPSESEILANGYNVGIMDAMLLQKIEELTLYIIELEKKIKKSECSNEEE